MNLKQLPQWQKNLYALWIGSFAVGTGSSMSMPFMPLFLSTMGNFPKWEISLYSGVAFAVTFVSQAIVSPMWGKLADRTGRKPMLMRAAIGMTITASLTSLAPNVWIVILLRLIQGIFSGYVSNAYALMASTTPQEQTGRVMGTLSTGMVSGQLIGPILGGVLASLFGYRLPFVLYGILMLFATLITGFLVHEDFTPAKKTEDAVAENNILKNLNHKGLLTAMFVSSMLVQAATTSINPILSLFIQELMKGRGDVALVSGIIAALPGIATIIAAPRLGMLGDHVGPQKVLLGGLMFCAMVFFPMFFVATVVQLGILRFLVGISDAALLPVIQSVITVNTPGPVVSRVFSYNQSFQAMGSVVGPMLASAISGILDFRYVFIMTTILVLVNLAVVYIAYRNDTAKQGA